MMIRKTTRENQMTIEPGKMWCIAISVSYTIFSFQVNPFSASPFFFGKLVSDLRDNVPFFLIPVFSVSIVSSTSLRNAKIQEVKNVVFHAVPVSICYAGHYSRNRPYKGRKSFTNLTEKFCFNLSLSCGFSICGRRRWVRSPTSCECCWRNEYVGYEISLWAILAFASFRDDPSKHCFEAIEENVGEPAAKIERR